MPTDRAERRLIDTEFFGLEDGPDACHTSFVVTDHLARPDGKLYGGTAIGVSLAAIEHATGKDAVWATTQFVGSAPLAGRVECVVDLLAVGRRTVQARVTATVDGDVMFAAVGAAAEFKPAGLTGQPELMAVVSSPEEGQEAMGRRQWGDRGWHAVVEMRSATPAREHPTTHPTRTYVWARMRDGKSFTPARLAFIADMVPVSVARALGAMGAGTSLDNTLRVGPMVDTEWVLIDLRPHFAFGGYGHGDAYLWAEDGTLLATASQTASMLLFDRDPLKQSPFPIG